MLFDVKLTQGDYWKGGQIPYWIYMILAAFPLTGMLGLDHVALRSPWTGLLKFLTLIPTLGFWYFYDMAQLFGERDLVEKYGLAVPWYGPVGLGAGIFLGKDVPVSPLEVPRPWKYMLYVFTSIAFFLVPLNLIVIGDYSGAVSRLLMYIMFPLTFIAILWGIYDIYRILFKTDEVFQKGTYRLPPASWIFGEYFNPSALGPNPPPPKTEAEKAAAASGSASTFWPFRLASAVGEIPIAGAKAYATAITAVPLGVSAVKDIAVESVRKVANSATDVVQGVIQTGDTLIKTTTVPLVDAAGKASSAASKTAGLLEKLPTIAQSVTEKISDKVANAAAAKAQGLTDKVSGSIDAASNSVASSVQGAANTVTGSLDTATAIAGSKVDSTLAKVMTGGAIASSINPSVSSTVLIFSVVLLAFSGYVFYTMRKSFSKITEDDDSPPDPKPVRGASEQGRQGK
jgi:hypothetical protein